MKIKKAKSPNGKGRNNTIIEFVGISGVGKTTLCDYYLKNHKQRFKKEIINRVELERYVRGSNIDFFRIEDKFGEYLLQQRLKSLNDYTRSSRRKVKLIHRSLNFVNGEYIIDKLDDKIFILDEHLMDHYRSLLPKALHEKSEVEKYLENRLFIYCTASAEQILSQKRKRARYGKNHPDYFPTPVEWKKAVQKEMENIENAFAVLQDQGVKVLEVNTADDLAENAKKN